MTWLYVSLGLALALGVLAARWLRRRGYRVDDDVVQHQLNPWWVPVFSAVGVLAAAPFAAQRPPMVLVTYVLALVWAVVLAFIDLEVRRLPDVLTLPAYPVVAVLLGLCSATTHDWPALLRAAACAGVATSAFLLAALFSPFGGESLGLGDVKLAGVLGALLGWFSSTSALMGFLTGFIIAGLGGLVLILARRATRTSHVALGPSLLLGTYLWCVLSLAL